MTKPKKVSSSKTASGPAKTKAPKAKVDPEIPTPATVVAKMNLVSGSGRKYRVLRTTQTDPYDPPDLNSKD